MKYWVYKESSILGPFDKEGVSGLQGLDQGTLICEGDPAGGSWRPAGEIADLAGLAPAMPEFSEFPTTAGLLDQLQIDTAGLVGDDDFPGALAEDLFKDANLKASFGDVLSAGSGGSGDAETRRAKEKVSELTIQLEHLYRHIAQLEASQTELARRLADKEIQLRAGGLMNEPVVPPEAPAPEAGAPARTFLSPAPSAPPAKAATPPPVPDAPAAPSEWAQPGALPAIFGGAEAPSKLVVPGVPGMPVPPAPPELPGRTTPPSSPDLPTMPAFTPPPAAPALPAAATAPVEAPKPAGFGKPKSFKIVPTVKSFKVLGAEGEAVSANPVPEFSAPEPVAAAPAPAPVTPPPAAVPPPAPVALEPIAPPPAPVTLAPIAPPPPAVATPAPAEIPNPFTIPTPAPAVPTPAPAAATPVPPMPTPAAPPPNTLSRSQPVPDLGSGDLAGPDDATTNLPPMTLARGRTPAATGTDDPAVAARFAKPEAAPATAPPKPARNNKPFLIGGAVLLVLLVITGVIFMRQPKDDLKQMATLDDGKAPIGVPADDNTVAPPMVKPKVAQPEAPPPPPPGPSAEHRAAIEAVKDFPLDGGRGTVGQWLQYSYTASPGAGAEEWNASGTGDNTILVEYRMVPGGSSGKGALYLFEVDANGLVMGKNLDARQMLAGSPPPEPPKPKAKKAPAKKVKRRPVIEEPKEVPQLPLPDSGELRPPAEDDGTFGSDTINSGI